MKSASTKMKNGFAAMRRSCVGARQAERRERMLHGRQRGKIRKSIAKKLAKVLKDNLPEGEQNGG